MIALPMESCYVGGQSMDFIHRKQADFSARLDPAGADLRFHGLKLALRHA
jgi:hypothetical protein